MNSVGRLSSLVSALLVVACGQDPVVANSSGGTPSEASGAPAPSSSAAAVPVARPPIDESDFAESARSRDPFRSFARFFQEETRSRVRVTREVVASEYSLEELKLVGIVTRLQPAKAMLVDPTGKGHVIQRGQFVGRADVVMGSGASGSTYEVNWRVDHIREGDVVLIRTDPTNPDVPTMTRVVQLRSEPADEK